MEQTARDEVTASPQVETALPNSANKRTDLVTAAIVEEGLRLLRTHGLEQASEYLSAQMVPLRVVQRVLLKPNERRKTEQR